jgi:hypothetical protein
MKTVKLTDHELFLLRDALYHYGNFLYKSQSNTSIQNDVDKLQDKIKSITQNNSHTVVCDI